MIELAFCGRCSYQIENRSAKCRRCGAIARRTNGNDFGDSSKPWYGLFLDQYQALSLEDQAHHYECSISRRPAFGVESYRFIYNPGTLAQTENSIHSQSARGSVTEQSKATINRHSDNATAAKSRPIAAAAQVGSPKPADASSPQGTLIPAGNQNQAEASSSSTKQGRRARRRAKANVEQSPWKVEPADSARIEADPDFPQKNASAEEKEKLKADFSGQVPDIVKKPVPSRVHVPARNPGPPKLTAQVRNPNEAVEDPVISTNDVIRGTVRDKYWFGAKCDCGGAHDQSVCVNHERYLEVFIDAYLEDEDGVCAICVANGKMAFHHLWQHGTGVWRDHPYNPKLPEHLEHLYRPYPKLLRLGPLPMWYYRPKTPLSDDPEETWFRPLGGIPPSFPNGLLGGLWDWRSRHQDRAFKEGLSKAVEVSRKIKDNQTDLQKRSNQSQKKYHESYLRPQVKLTGSTDTSTGQKSILMTDPNTFGGLQRHTALSDPGSTGWGSVKWFEDDFESDMSRVMDITDRVEIERLGDVHRRYAQGRSVHPSVLHYQANAVHMAWMIYACYVPHWRPGRSYDDIDGCPGFKKSINELRNVFGIWPKKELPEIDMKPSTKSGTKAKEDVGASTKNTSRLESDRKGKGRAARTTESLDASSTGEVSVQQPDPEQTHSQGAPPSALGRVLGFVADLGFEAKHQVDCENWADECNESNDMTYMPVEDAAAKFHIDTFSDWHERMKQLEQFHFDAWTEWFASKIEVLKEEISGATEMAEQKDRSKAFHALLDVFSSDVQNAVECLFGVNIQMKVKCSTSKTQDLKVFRSLHHNLSRAFDSYERDISDALEMLCQGGTSSLYHLLKTWADTGYLSDAFDGINGAWLPGHIEPETKVKIFGWPLAYVVFWSESDSRGETTLSEE